MRRCLNLDDAPENAATTLYVGSFPLPVTVLKGGFIKGFVEFLLSIVLTDPERGNDSMWMEEILLHLQWIPNILHDLTYLLPWELSYKST